MMRCTLLIALSVFVGSVFVGASARAAQASGAVARNELARGTAAMDAGRVEEARSAFAMAAQNAPEWGLAHLGLGIAEQTIDPDSDRARAELEAAVQLEPENPKAHYHLGLAYERKGRFTEAAKQYSLAIANRPQMTEARFQLASCLRTGGDDAGAALVYEALLQNEPGHIGALIGLSEIYERQQRLIEAESALTTITRLQPTVAYHQYRLANFYERIGNPRKAQAAYGRADTLKPKAQRKMRPLLKSR